MNNLTVLTHTHTDCKDVWPVYSDSYKEFFLEAKHCVLINKAEKFLGENASYIEYNESTSHVDRIIFCLEKIDTEFVIISFEDMWLLGRVHVKKLNSIMQLMNDKGIAFTRLLRSGVRSQISYGENLWQITPYDLQISMTPTVWNREILIKKLKLFKGSTLWKLEADSQVFIDDQEWTGLYWYAGEPAVGGHFHSSIYPHICSGLYKGKWLVREYRKEIEEMRSKYDIDLNIRGFH
jgi:hypothetical protein